MLQIFALFMPIFTRVWSVLRGENKKQPKFGYNE
jgi:hypothetical protein